MKLLLSFLCLHIGQFTSSKFSKQNLAESILPRAVFKHPYPPCLRPSSSKDFHNLNTTPRSASYTRSQALSYITAQHNKTNTSPTSIQDVWQGKHFQQLRLVQERLRLHALYRQQQRHKQPGSPLCFPLLTTKSEANANLGQQL